MDSMEESDDEKCMFSDNEQIKTCLAQSSESAQLKKTYKEALEKCCYAEQKKTLFILD